MMNSNVIVGITISRGTFAFSQSRVKVSASLTNEGSLAVGAFDLVNCSLSVVRFVLVFLESFTLVSKCRNVVVGLWATRPPSCATQPSRRRRRCLTQAPTSKTASHENHEKINSRVSSSFLYENGAPLGRAPL